MTSEVALKVDILASLAVDKALSTEEDTPPPPVPASSHDQAEQNSSTAGQREQLDKQSSPPIFPSPTAGSSSSSLSSLSSSSQGDRDSAICDISDSTNNNNNNNSNNESPKSSGSIEVGSAGGSCSEADAGPTVFKKRKMVNDLDFLSDSGIPMEGIELDSSTITADESVSSQQQLASTTGIANNIATTTTANDIRSSNSSEAVASNSPALSFCEESKLRGYSPDYAAETAAVRQVFNSNVVGMDDGNNDTLPQHNQASQNNQHDKSQVSNQSSTTVRSFGDLFDDDDLV